VVWIDQAVYRAVGQVGSGIYARVPLVLSAFASPWKG